jgi:phospholipid transport system transporter-binding protein
VSGLQLPAVLNQRTATASLAHLHLALAQAGPSVQLDAAALEQFDSVAVSVLLDLQRAAQARGQSLAMAGLPERLLDLARVYGVAELLGEGRAASPT